MYERNWRPQSHWRGRRMTCITRCAGHRWRVTRWQYGDQAKFKGAIFFGSSRFAPHNIWELNILTSNRFHEIFERWMFERWTSSSFAWQIPLSRGWRLSITSSRPFCYVWFIRVGLKICTDSYVNYEHSKWTWCERPYSQPHWQWNSSSQTDWSSSLKHLLTPITRRDI